MGRFSVETGSGAQALLLAHASPSLAMKKPEVKGLGENPGVVAHTFSPDPQEAEVGGSL